MAQALDPAAYIHEGFWVDWTKSTVGGLTLTLCPTSATFLTNSMALFVALSGGQLWTIFRFSLHQLQASSSTPETPRSQQRIVLRNATTDLSTARLMWLAAWRSRGSTRKPSSLSICIGLFAVFHAVLFMAAGTFSNKLIMSAKSTTAPSMVLSKSDRCGVWNQTYYDLAANDVNWSGEQELALSVQYIAKTSLNTQLSLEYAKECYISQPPSYMSSTCNTLKVARLGWEDRSGACPFGRELCHAQSDTLVMDTGVINSHDHLGINAKHQDRLTYRRLTTCAVLNETDYVDGWDNSDDSRIQQTAFAYYGASQTRDTDWTYSYSNFASFYTNFTLSSVIPYQLNVQKAYGKADPQWTSSDFVPISGLGQKASDLVLLFLSFSGRYLDKVDDPWFSASQLHHVDGPYEIAQKQYARDKAISALGCTEQHQFCTNTMTCTPSQGFDQVQNNDYFNSVLTERQNATFDRMLRAIAASSLYIVIGDLAETSTPLLATNATAVGNNLFSLPLPEDQWKIELNYWHAIAMAQLQRTIVQWGTGQIAPEPSIDHGLYLLPPELDQDSWFCNNLIIPSTIYQSFSVISIIAILISGLLVIIISLTIENLAGCIQKRLSKLALLKIWEEDDMLRLQCRTNEDTWKPRTPPKDNQYGVGSPKRAPIEMVELGAMQSLPRDLRLAIDNANDRRRPSSEALPPEHLTFPFPRYEMQVRGPNAQSALENRPEPDRDSWVAISLASYDAVIPEAQARDILDSGFRRLPPQPIFATGPLSVTRHILHPEQAMILPVSGDWI